MEMGHTLAAMFAWCDVEHREGASKSDWELWGELFLGGKGPPLLVQLGIRQVTMPGGEEF